MILFKTLFYSSSAKIILGFVRFVSMKRVLLCLLFPGCHGDFFFSQWGQNSTEGSVQYCHSSAFGLTWSTRHSRENTELETGWLVG